MLPFSRAAFLSLFEQYNAAIWPAPVIAGLLGVVVLALALRPLPGSSRVISLLLSLAWLWNGVVYHGLYFAGINFWAYGFAVLFVVQGLLFAAAALRGRSDWRFRADPAGWAGPALMGFALVGYPLLAWAFGDGWPRMAAFGVAPAPTVIFTWGLLLMAPRAAYLALGPLAWSLIGAAIAVSRGVPEDLSLLLAAGISMVLIIRGRRKPAAGRP